MPTDNTHRIINIPEPDIKKEGWPWQFYNSDSKFNVKNYPKISIITPSFNQGNFIEETIRSVLLQNYPNLEYILIDGGSTDNSLKIINKYSAYFDFWVSEKDSGQSQAINKGLLKATGEIMTWINSDDILMPNTLHQVAEIFNNNKDISLVHGKSILFKENSWSKIIGANNSYKNNNYLATPSFPQPSTFFKSEVLSLGLLNENLHYGMDYDLFVRISLCYKTKYINSIWSKYRIHETSKTNQTSISFAIDRQNIMSKVINSFNFTENYKLVLKKLDFYTNIHDYYQVNNKIDEFEIEQVFLLFLKSQAQSYYQIKDLVKVTSIIRSIVKIRPMFLFSSITMLKIYLLCKMPILLKVKSLIKGK